MEMITVTLKSGTLERTVQTEKENNLLDIIHNTDLFIDAPCSGKGSCKKCIVYIDNKPCLACQTRINTNITVIIPENKVISLEKKDYAFEDIEYKPVIEKVVIEFDTSNQPQYSTDCDWFIESLKKNGYNILIPKNIELLNKINYACHTPGKHNIYLYENNNSYKIIDILYGDTHKNYGIAIDLGTTTVSIVLIDIDTKDIIDSIGFYNPQLTYGADIIHRIVYSQKKGGNIELKEKLLSEIEKSIGQLFIKNSINPDEINAVCFSGNTTMIHLMLGLNSRFIRENPYTPVTNSFSVMNSTNLFQTIQNAAVFIIPGVANYVGGDITSGVAVCNFLNSEEINILIDIGTNGEIIIGNKDWFVGSACSAGPAFEGMGLNCGMRYMNGAIYRIYTETHEIKCDVAGSKNPIGISGTAIINLIKILRERNYIDKRGKFTDKITTTINDKKAFILIDAKKTDNNKPIYINEIDIDNILRAKAAIHAGIKLILKKLSIDINSISNFYIAGGIGNSLNIDDGLEIGLFPPIPKEKIHFVGNTSLKGAINYLIDKTTRKTVYEIAQKTTYIDLGNETAYMDEFMAALFIPHTDY